MSNSQNKTISQIIRHIGDSLRQIVQSVGQWTQVHIMKKPLPAKPERIGLDGLTGDIKPVEYTSGINQATRKPHKKFKPIKRLSRQRVYRLKGYTTVAKINHKRQSERQQRLLRHLLIVFITVLLVMLLFYLYKPVKDLTELYRIIGVKDLYDLNPSITSTLDPTAATDQDASHTTASTTSASSESSTSP
ncbi:MAG: hypothetical protein VB070_02440 [Clostridiaceae bacterium]|nr:hypothetical protein [Clostridiaceae bacterium]